MRLIVKIHIGFKSRTTNNYLQIYEDAVGGVERKWWWYEKQTEYLADIAMVCNYASQEQTERFIAKPLMPQI